MSKKVYPSGTTFGNYFICSEKLNGEDSFSIRRRITLPSGEVNVEYPRFVPGDFLILCHS